MDEDMTSLPSDLDTSWVDQESEPIDMEPMTEMGCWLLYIDSEGNLQHVYRSKLPLDVDNGSETIRSRFPRARLLQFLHTKKTHQGLKYRLMDILLYHVDVEPERLLSGADTAKEGDALGKLTSVMLQDDLLVPASLCIFHEVNCLYFLFQEPPKYDDDDDEDDMQSAPRRPLLNLPVPVSEGGEAPMTLASAFLNRGKLKKTKKVTFQDMAYRYTRKRALGGAGAGTSSV